MIAKSPNSQFLPSLLSDDFWNGCIKKIFIQKSGIKFISITLLLWNSLWFTYNFVKFANSPKNPGISPVNLFSDKSLKKKRRESIKVKNNG
jgi:hypothetical protein